MRRLVGWALVVTLMAFVAGPGVRTQEPNSDIPAPDGLRANRVTFSPVMDVLKATRQPVTDEQLAQLATLPSRRSGAPLATTASITFAASRARSPEPGSRGEP